MQAAGSDMRKRVAGSFELYPADEHGETATLIVTNQPPPPPGTLMSKIKAILTDNRRSLIMDGLVALKLLVSLLISETRLPSPSSSIWIPSSLAPEYSYPLLAQTIPAWALPLLALLLPIVIFTAIKVVNKRSSSELVRLSLTLCSSVFLTALVTNVIKVLVSRPRPNFLSVCFGSTTPTYQGGNSLGGYPICITTSNLGEHLKSFPSGHSSFAAAGLGFLSFYLLGLTRCFVGESSAGRLVLSLLPSLVAIIVGVTRVKDSWHHPSDVVAGLALGFIISFLFYRILYPSFSHKDCDVPLSECECDKVLNRDDTSEMNHLKPAPDQSPV